MSVAAKAMAHPSATRDIAELAVSLAPPNSQPEPRN
jgi:hypothetical protein